MIEFKKKVFVLVLYIDDGEFGCGGIIVKLIVVGYEVFYVVFFVCQQFVLLQFLSDIFIMEVKVVMLVLGIKLENLLFFDYDVRIFGYYCQEIFDDMIKMCKDIDLDLIFMFDLNDVYQDYYIIVIEGFCVFKFKFIFFYELFWNNLLFIIFCFIYLEEWFV